MIEVYTKIQERLKMARVVNQKQLLIILSLSCSISEDSSAFRCNIGTNWNYGLQTIFWQLA